MFKCSSVHVSFFTWGGLIHECCPMANGHTDRVACHVLLPEASASQGASRGSPVTSCCQWPTKSVACHLARPLHAASLVRCQCQWPTEFSPCHGLIHTALNLSLTVLRCIPRTLPIASGQQNLALTLTPCCETVANGQRNLAPDTAKSIPAHMPYCPATAESRPHWAGPLCCSTPGCHS